MRYVWEHRDSHVTQYTGHFWKLGQRFFCNNRLCLDHDGLGSLLLSGIRLDQPYWHTVVKNLDRTITFRISANRLCLCATHVEIIRAIFVKTFFDVANEN